MLISDSRPPLIESISCLQKPETLVVFPGLGYYPTSGAKRRILLCRLAVDGPNRAHPDAHPFSFSILQSRQSWLSGELSPITKNWSLSSLKFSLRRVEKSDQLLGSTNSLSISRGLTHAGKIIVRFLILIRVGPACGHVVNVTQQFQSSDPQSCPASTHPSGRKIAQI